MEGQYIHYWKNKESGDLLMKEAGLAKTMDESIEKYNQMLSDVDGTIYNHTVFFKNKPQTWKPFFITDIIQERQAQDYEEEQEERDYANFVKQIR